MKSIVLFTAAFGVLALGCRSANSRLNAPPHGAQTEGPPDLQGTYVYMADNALLESMDISDYHFLPHRDLLTTLGKQRLNRLASLIEEYGGTIRFNTKLTDDILVQQRTQSIIEYLQDIGVDTGTTMVSREGFDDTGTHAADEAILIKVMEGTYRPKKSGSGGGSASGSSASGGSFSGN